MEAFSAEWLALREPADHAARRDAPGHAGRGRSGRVPRHRRDRRRSRRPARDRTCATCRARLPFGQRWTLVDHDQRLLNQATRDWELAGDAAPHGVTVRARRVDLARLDESAFTGAAAGAPQAPLLVTASALLDLTSVDWLDALAARCRAPRAVTLFALTYDGRITCEPPRSGGRDGAGAGQSPPADGQGLRPRRRTRRRRSRRDAFEREGSPCTARGAIGSWAPSRKALQQQLVNGWAPGRRGLSPARCRRHRRVARAPHAKPSTTARRASTSAMRMWCVFDSGSGLRASGLPGLPLELPR